MPLRSLYLDCAADTAIAALGTVGLTPFASQGRADTIVADTVVNRVTETLYEVSAGQDRLLIGVQAIADAPDRAASGDPRIG